MGKNIEDYSYDLPQGNIAQKPLRRRDSSRLMVCRRNSEGIVHARFSNLPDYLRRGDLLVVNDSSVMPARLTGRKIATGGKVEALLLRQAGRGRWRSLLKGKAVAGTKLDFGLAGVETTIEEIVGDGEVILRFRPAAGGELLMRKKGLPPLPPYIRRDESTPPSLKASDRRRYQTLYAAREGSAAAPTAGLHFTKGLLDRLGSRGVLTAPVTLHVGPATFRPLRTERVERISVPGERAFVPAATVRAVAAAKKRGGRVVAVGTTVTRTLEDCTGCDGLEKGWREVGLTIRPGHRFRTVDGLITNFHLPRSSLLLLVAAFAGRERVLDLYGRAVREGYRFYSYGDAMLIL